jgi:hypothetical protein
MGRRVLATVLLVTMVAPPPALAEWQVKPFIGLTFGGSTTLIDLEQAVGKANPVIGVNGGAIGEVVGFDVDFGRAPGFFQWGHQSDPLLLSSQASTMTWNAVIAMPRRMTQYTLRPYFVGGAGLVHASIEGRLGAVHFSITRPALDFGGGVTGFLTKRAGLSWEIRHFGTIGKGQPTGASLLGEERLSFWRATMSVAFRY